MSQLRHFSPEKRARLLKTLIGKASFPAEVALIRRRSRTDLAPLSYAQQRLWFLDQLEPGNPTYNVFSAMRLKGELKIPALSQALNESIRRHESLRTCFPALEDGPAQRIAEAASELLKVIDLSGCEREEAERKLDRLGREDARHLFDISEGPLLRVTLVRKSVEEHVVLLSTHHIISDGWSMRLLIVELERLYPVFAGGEPSPLPELPIQYADYAIWQREYLQGEVLERQLEYWRKRLEGASFVLNLPTEHPRSPMKTYRGADRPLLLSAELTQGLRELGHSSGATVFMTLLAGFQVLLARYSHQDDVLVGVPIAGRTREETETLIGFFINVLVMRGDLSEAPSFLELLGRVKETALGAYAHQDLPFEKLVEELQPERDPGRSPLFQVTFQVQNIPVERKGLQVPELRSQRYTREITTAQFDLSLTMIERLETIDGTIVYDLDLFDDAAIDRMLSHFENLLAGIVADPSLPVWELPLLSESEREQLLVEWAGSGREFAEEESLAELFERQATRRPDGAAIVYEDQALSYGELNRRANQLAHHLRELGVGPEAPVGICLERSLEMVIGILGILKAGGAYVPLDPALPEERLAFILEDARAAVRVKQEGMVERLAGRPMQEVCLDADWKGLVGQSEENLGGVVSADNAAYVIYTSGSTGRPKGTVVSHRNVSRLFEATRRQFEFDETDVWTMFHSCAFDFSVWEMFGALLTGGRLVVAPYWVSRSAEDFHRLMSEELVTVLNQTPSAFRELMRVDEASKNGGEGSLRKVIFGGEALELQSLRGWFWRYGDRRPQLVNMYGITETTVHVTSCQIGAADAEEEKGSVIGRPLEDLQIYLMDERMNLVPPRMMGEIYVGGGGVSRGYLKRADLTAERFIPNPYSQTAGAVLYRTGDLARYHSEGSIEFIGRIDHQVKVRGYRIELGEIEEVLKREPGVREAVVTMREDEPGEKRLVAYVVSEVEWREGAEIGRPWASELKERLREKLPEYMTPAVIVELKHLHLTANGKVDRKALPAPGGEAYRARIYEEPLGQIERRLARVWSEALNVERVGRHDNFFELGGHSLMAVTLIERMRGEGLQADVKTLLTKPTLADLAGAVDDRHAVEAPPNRIPKQCEGITPEMLPLVELTTQEVELIVNGAPGGASNVQDIYPLTPLQEGILFEHLLGRQGDVYLLRMLLGFDSEIRLQSFVKALQLVIRRHDILRTAVVWEGLREPVQVVWREAPLPVHQVDLEPEAGDVAGQLRSRFDPRHFRLDLRRAPLMRADVTYDAVGQRWLLSLLFHHLALDHTTQEILFQEVHAYLVGESNQLIEPLPFRNFVARARLERREDHEQFFRGMLADVDEPTAPFGFMDVQGDGTRIAEAKCELELELARRIRARAGALGVSAASICHLAWAQVLARVSGRDDVVFGTVLFGRMQGGEGADKALGMFINTLPVRIRVGDQDVEAGVWQTHTLLAELLGHDHASLALAQRCSAIPAPAPLFTSLLNYRHSPEAPKQAAAEMRKGWRGIEILESEERTNYPVSLSVDDMGAGFWLTAQVQRPIDAERVCRMMERALEELINALERAPETVARAIDALPEVERTQVVEEWNATAREYPRDRCIHQLFETQAARRPDATAVAHEGRHVSYGELNERANRLAHYLRELGVRPDARVAICVERSLEMVISLLATLKAGGAYVPLDPTYPADRLTYMLTASQPVAVLAHPQSQTQIRSALAGAGAMLVDPPVIDLEADGGNWAGASNTDPIRGGAGLTSEHLAYVIFTSGSTGHPKGVMVEHRGVVNLLCSMQEILAAGPTDCVLALTTIAFDIAGLELYLPLVCGARLALAGSVERQDPVALAEKIATSGATIVQATPATWRMLLDAGWNGAGGLKALCGGEALPTELARRVGKQVGRLWNVYGPTETTIWSSTAEADAITSPEGGAHVSIGRPIANTQIYLLDHNLRPTPIGVTGKIYIGGAGVARGYLNLPELSAERFVANPFADQTNVGMDQRIYQTGDLGRYLPDGRIEYLGRDDFQVKIRGFRIELGEIEERLARHPAIREAVVVARDDGAGDRRLVAYCTLATNEAKVDSQALRAHLSTALPEYMVPAAIVELQRLPLTASGKVDRKALPAPVMREETGEGEESRTAIEEIIAGIWAEVLKLERVGVKGNFFELGGHSLLATQVISRVREVLGAEVDLQVMFERPTVAGLAEAVEKARGLGVERSPIETVAREGELPLSYAQQRLWFIDQLDPESAAYNMPSAVRLKGELRTPALEQLFSEIVRRHESLRTSFPTRDHKPVQRIAEARPIQLPIIDLSGLDSTACQQTTRRLVRDATQHLFNLATGPLLRVGALRLSDDDHVVLQTMHHIISDGWSMRVLAGEVKHLYGAYAIGKPSPLEELQVQYADYAHWQRQWLKGETLERQLSFWKNKLEGMRQMLNLPIDRPRSKVQGYHGASSSWKVPEALSEKVNELSRREGSTLFMTFLAAFKVLLHCYSDQDDIVVGTPIANRAQMEIEPLIGFFANTLVLRTKLSGNPGFRELLSQVRENCLEAYANQDIPFEYLVQELQPERSLSQVPLFQVMFAFQNAPNAQKNVIGNDHRQSPESPGISLRSSSVDFEWSPFDLLVQIEERNNSPVVTLLYRTALFTADTIQRVFEDYGALLQNIALRPDIRLDSLREVFIETNRQRHLIEKKAVREVSLQKFLDRRRIPVLTS